MSSARSIATRCAITSTASAFPLWVFAQRARGAAHGRLWDALRKKGRQVRVIGIAAENQTVDRTVRVLRAWVAADL